MQSMETVNSASKDDELMDVVSETNSSLPQKFSKKSWLVFFVAIVLILVTLFLFVIMKNITKIKKSDLPTKTNNQLIQKIEEATYEDKINLEKNSTVKNIEVKNYQSSSDLVIIPPKNLNIFALKNNYSLESAKKFTEKLVGGEIDLVSNTEDSFVFQNNQNMMTFHAQSGDFELISGEIEVGESATTDDGSMMTKFLKERIVGFDDSIVLTSIYEKESAPGVKYYEFHRSWEKIGLPIINPAAILTLSKDKKITDFSLSKFEKDDPDDADIIKSSDQKGKARKTDFNTMTVALLKTGKIESIISNIRFIENTKGVDEKNFKDLTLKTIITKLKKENTIYDQALPVGEGQIDLQKVFPNGELKTENGQIDDIALVFFEKNPQQLQFFLQPMILIRGKAKTTGGFEVNFSQSLPLVENAEFAIDFQN